MSVLPQPKPLVIGLLGRTVVTYENQVTPTGLKGAGKDTVALYLADDLKQLGYNVHILRLAAPLKETVCDVYGLDMAELENDRFKKEQDNISGKCGTQFSYRQLLEYFGTDVVRRSLGQDHWVDMLLAKISQLTRPPLERLIVGLSGSKDITLPEAKAMADRIEELNLAPCQSKPVAIIVADVRFHNEWQKLLHVPGAVCVSVLVQRSMGQVSLEQFTKVSEVLSKSNHVSNCWDDRIAPHVWIPNNGTLGELKNHVDILAKHITRK